MQQEEGPRAPEGEARLQSPQHPLWSRELPKDQYSVSIANSVNARAHGVDVDRGDREKRVCFLGDDLAS